MTTPQPDQPSLKDLQTQNEYALGDTTIVGRHEDCQLILKSEQGASRKHARITVENGAAVLVDLGSLNGTLVNGREISRAVQLVDGDILIFDEQQYLFQAARSTQASNNENVTIIANKDEIGRPDRIKPAIRFVDVANPPNANSNEWEKTRIDQGNAANARQHEPQPAQHQQPQAEQAPVRQPRQQPPVQQPRQQQAQQPPAQQQQPRQQKAQQPPAQQQRPPQQQAQQPAAQPQQNQQQQIQQNAQPLAPSHQQQPQQQHSEAQAPALNNEQQQGNPQYTGNTAIPATSRPGGDAPKPQRIQKRLDQEESSRESKELHEKYGYTPPRKKSRLALWVIIVPLFILLLLGGIYLAYNAGVASASNSGTITGSS